MATHRHTRANSSKTNPRTVARRQHATIPSSIGPQSLFILAVYFSCCDWISGKTRGREKRGGGRRGGGGAEREKEREREREREEREKERDREREIEREREKFTRTYTHIYTRTHCTSIKLHTLTFKPDCMFKIDNSCTRVCACLFRFAIFF